MFENILGNNSIKNLLSNSIKTDKVSHSYMFVGISGIGKKIIAKDFAKGILCLNKDKYCNNCKSCIEFDSNNNPDLIYIEPDGNNIKIEQIRELQKRIPVKPIISNRKVCIINDADTMTKNYEIEPTSNMLDLFQGSIGKAIELKDKQEQYENIRNIVTKLNSNDLIDTIKTAESLYKNKEEIYELLEYINITLLKMAKTDYRYTNCIQIVENTKQRLKQNANYDMCIDNMLFNMWEEIN